MGNCTHALMKGSWRLGLAMAVASMALSGQALAQQASDATSRPDVCQQGEIVRPANGAILAAVPGEGDHYLTIHNSPGADAIVKLKSAGQKTIVSMYVRAGQSATAQNIPDGRWQFQYATGSNYSPACGRFLTDMQANKDPGYQAYQTTQEGNYLYSSEMAYTLTRVANGNFEPSRMDPDAF